MPPEDGPPILITIPPMIASELCRFVLDHYGVAHREEPHGFGFSFGPTLLHGGTLSAPILYDRNYSLSGPRAIIDHFDGLAGDALRLFPRDAVMAATVTRDWDRYYGDLASAMAVFAYYHLLPLKDAMIDPLSLGAPEYEVRAVRNFYPVFSGILGLLLGLSAGKAAAALVTVRTIFDEVASRLADGRRYLAGDALTASDVSFATAAATVILPPNYTAVVPPLTQMPPALQAVIAQLRAHKAGEFVIRIYQERPRGEALLHG